MANCVAEDERRASMVIASETWSVNKTTYRLYFMRQGAELYRNIPRQFSRLLRCGSADCEHKWTELESLGGICPLVHDSGRADL